MAARRVGLTTANVDSNIFYLWPERDLIPKPPAGAVRVMGNATFHWRADIIEIIAWAGHGLEFLLPYSPDLNLIEHKWAQAKARRRKTGVTVEGLFRTQFCVV